MANIMKKVKVGKNQPINISAPNNNALKAKADRIYQPTVGNMVVQDKFGNVVDAGFSATELQNTLEDLQGQIGNLNNLTTTAKNNVVAAINEVDSDISTINTTIGNKNNLSTTATNLVGAINEVKGIADSAASNASTAYHYKGTKATVSALPSSSNTVGDVWNVGSTLDGGNYAWTGSAWDKLGDTVDLSGYLTKTEASSTYATKTELQNANYLTKSVADDLYADKSLYTSAWKSYVEEELTSLGASIASIEIPEGLTEEEAQAIAEEQAARQAEEQEKKLAAMHLPVWVDNAKVKTNFYVNKNYTQDYTVSSNKITLKVKGISSGGNAKLNNRVYDITYDTNKIIFTNSIGTGNNAVEIDKVTANISDTEIEIADGFYTPTYSSGSLVKLTAIPKDTDNGLYGRFEEFPWNTIAFATSSVASNYNINTNNVYIKITGGTDTEGIYTEATSINLAQQNKTSGSIILSLKDSTKPVTIKRSFAGTSTVLNHTGGSWIVRDMNLELELQDTSSVSFPHLIYSESSEGLTIKSCNLKFVDSCTSTNSTAARLIAIHNNGLITFDNSGNNNVTTWEGNKVNAYSVTWLFADTAGSIVFIRAGSNALKPYLYKIESVFSTFCNLNNKSMLKEDGVPISTSNSNTYNLPQCPMFIYKTVDGNNETILNINVTYTYDSNSVVVEATNPSSGIRFKVNSGSSCNTDFSNISNSFYPNSSTNIVYFPGDIDTISAASSTNTVDSNTYAWYK